MSNSNHTDADEQLAQDVLAADDIRERKEKNLSAAGYLEGKYNLDLSAYDDRYDLRDALRDARHDLPPERQRVEANESDGNQRVTDMGIADQRAKGAMVMEDLHKASQSDMGPAGYLRDEFGIDAADYSDANELRAELNSARAENKRNWNQ